MNNKNIIKLEEQRRAIEFRTREILKLDPANRLRAIIDSPQSAALVQSLPPQELLLTIKRVGEVDAMPLIEMASPAQVQFLTDVEWWIGDSLDPDRVLHWLKIFDEIGERKVVEWLKSVDGEALITLLSKFIAVTKPEEDEPAQTLNDALPPVTFDGVYHINFFNENAQRILTPVLKRFAIARNDLFMRILEGTIWESGPETREMALRWRNGRLRDHGVPDLNEALEIYRYITESRFYSLPLKDAAAAFESFSAPPQYALVPMEDDRALFLDAISRIKSESVMDGIAQELARLVNCVLIADAEDLSDADAMMRAAKKVRATVGMGLEILAGGDADKAAEIIQTRWLSRIFQLGHSRALKLTRMARKMAGKGIIAKTPEATELLDEPLKQIFVGLRNPRPAWYVGGAEPYRSFLSLDEIAQAERALAKIDYLLSLCFDRLKLLAPEPESWKISRVYPIDITLSVVMRTAFANAAAERGFEFKPLRTSDLKTLIGKAFENAPDKKGKRRMRENIRVDLIAYLESRQTANNDSERTMRDEFVAECLSFLENELGRLDLGRLISPRFVQGILIRK